MCAMSGISAPAVAVSVLLATYIIMALKDLLERSSTIKQRTACLASWPLRAAA